ncbi:MAG: ribonuclease III [Caulobacterales bacterium]
MEKNDPVAALEARIDYSFKRRALIEEALTHSSAGHGRAGALTNERLEFLGDRVLGLVVSEHLYARHPSEAEHGLAPRLNALVNRGACARAAERADIGAALVLSKAEAQAGGRKKEAILADACEAVIAALYLDGGFEESKRFIMHFWADEFDAVAKAPKDPKTALQEFAAAMKREGPRYDVISRTGPDHAPVFVIDAVVEGFDPARGEGGSKREAEQAAAAALLKAAGFYG